MLPPGREMGPGSQGSQCPLPGLREDFRHWDHKLVPSWCFIAKAALKFKETMGRTKEIIAEGAFPCTSPDRRCSSIFISIPFYTAEMYAGIFATDRFPCNCDRADQKSGSPTPETNLDTLYAFLGEGIIFSGDSGVKRLPPTSVLWLTIGAAVMAHWLCEGDVGLPSAAGVVPRKRWKMVLSVLSTTSRNAASSPASLLQ